MAQKYLSIKRSLRIKENKLKLKLKSNEKKFSSSIAAKEAGTAGNTGPKCLFEGTHADSGSGGRDGPVHAAGVDLHLVACRNKDFLSYFTSAFDSENSRWSYGASATGANSLTGEQFQQSWGGGRSARASTRPLGSRPHWDRLRDRPAAGVPEPC